MTAVVCLPFLLNVLKEALLHSLKTSADENVVANFEKDFVNAIRPSTDLEFVAESFAQQTYLDPEFGLITFCRTEEESRAIRTVAILYEGKLKKLSNEALQALSIHAAKSLVSKPYGEVLKRYHAEGSEIFSAQAERLIQIIKEAPDKKEASDSDV